MTVTGSILLLITSAFQTWLVIVLIRRRAHRTFRWFFTYTVFALVAEIAKFAVRNHAWPYFYVAWASEAFYAILGFGATLEVFHRVFRNFYHQWWIRFLVPIVSLLMLVPAMLWVFTGPLRQQGGLLGTIFAIEIVVRCLQAGVFLLVFVLARFFNLYWRQYAFGIAAGFFVSTFGLVLTILVRSEFVTGSKTLLRYGPAVAYIVAVLIWLASFFRPEPDVFENARDRFTPELFIEQLEQYKKQIKDLLKPWWSLIYSWFILQFWLPR
jgi:hypothetical protein